MPVGCSVLIVVVLLFKKSSCDMFAGINALNINSFLLLYLGQVIDLKGSILRIYSFRRDRLQGSSLWYGHLVVNIIFVFMCTHLLLIHHSQKCSFFCC